MMAVAGVIRSNQPMGSPRGAGCTEAARMNTPGCSTKQWLRLIYIRELMWLQNCCASCTAMPVTF